MHAILELRARNSANEAVIWASKHLSAIEVIPSKDDRLMLRSTEYGSPWASSLVVRRVLALASLDGYLVVFNLDERTLNVEGAAARIISDLRTIGWDVHGDTPDDVPAAFSHGQPTE